MTPFGLKIREHRARRGISLKKMAEDLGVSSAYFSALEHGHRGRPGSGLIQQICGYFQLMWDEAEDLKRRADVLVALAEMELASSGGSGSTLQ